jgi:hypothetical protein
MTSIFLHGPGSWAFIGPSKRRAGIDKGVNPLCWRRASHRQYSTIAYWAQQGSDAIRDPQEGTASADNQRYAVVFSEVIIAAVFPQFCDQLPSSAL